MGFDPLEEFWERFGFKCAIVEVLCPVLTALDLKEGPDARCPVIKAFAVARFVGWVQKEDGERFEGREMISDLVLGLCVRTRRKEQQRFGIGKCTVTAIHCVIEHRSRTVTCANKQDIFAVESTSCATQKSQGRFHVQASCQSCVSLACSPT